MPQPSIDLAIEGDVLVADERWRRRDESGFAGSPMAPVHETPVDGTLFLVIDHRMTGGQEWPEWYPNGHQVTVKQLHPDGSYDPNGMVLRFYQSGCFSPTIHPPKFAGWRMTRTYVREEASSGQGTT